MIFFVLFCGTWMVFAIFSGGTVAMVMDERRSFAQRSLPLAATLLAGITSLFIFSGNLLPGYATRTVVGVITLSLLVSSVVVFWRAADSAGRTFRAFSLLSLILACLCFAGTTFVMPMLWGPSGGFDLIRLAFAAGVLLVAFCAAFAFRAAEKGPLTIRPVTWLGHVTLFVIIVLMVLSVVFSTLVRALWEEHEHQRSLDLYRAMAEFGNHVKALDIRSDAAVFPVDLKAKSAREYLDRLREQSPDAKLDFDLSRVQIANVSRSDPPGTVLLRSDGDECQVNIFMDVAGAAPRYPRGWFALNKNGDVWFYQRNGDPFPALPPSPKMTDPPRTPTFLPED